MQLSSEQFKKIREVYRLTQLELAELLGISQGYVTHVEVGRRKLSRNVSEKLTDKLGITPEKMARINEMYEEFSVSSGTSGTCGTCATKGTAG